MTVDVDTLPDALGERAGSALFRGTEATKALGELPGESWLALGVGSVGGTLATDVKALEGLASLGSSLGVSKAAGKAGEASAITIRGLSVKSLLKGLLTPLAIMGADTPQRGTVRLDGPAGLFAAGNGLLELEGGVVIDSNDAARSTAAVPALAAELEQAGDSVGSGLDPGNGSGDHGGAGGCRCRS